MTVFIGNKKSYASASHWSEQDNDCLLVKTPTRAAENISGDKNRYFLNAIILRPKNRCECGGAGAMVGWIYFCLQDKLVTDSIPGFE